MQHHILPIDLYQVFVKQAQFDFYGLFLVEICPNKREHQQTGSFGLVKSVYPLQSSRHYRDYVLSGSKSDVRVGAVKKRSIFVFVSCIVYSESSLIAPTLTSA